jgi:hypothetical protein
LRHAFNALASFCARVEGLGLAAGVLVSGVMFPAPENVSLEGAPKNAGCGVGDGLHASPVSHGGGVVAAVEHGDSAVHSCASYTSTAVS